MLISGIKLMDNKELNAILKQAEKRLKQGKKGGGFKAKAGVEDCALCQSGAVCLLIGCSVVCGECTYESCDKRDKEVCPAEFVKVKDDEFDWSCACNVYSGYVKDEMNLTAQKFLEVLIDAFKKEKEVRKKKGAAA